MNKIDNYRTGNKILDQQHIELLNLINQFKITLSGDKSKADKEVGNVLIFLVNHITTYFPMEEEYLRSINFEGLEQHIKEHKDFSKKVYETLNILKIKKSFRPIQLYYLLYDWKENHINISGNEYIKF